MKLRVHQRRLKSQTRLIDQAYWLLKRNHFHWDLSAAPPEIFNYLDVSSDYRKIRKTKPNPDKR